MSDIPEMIEIAGRKTRRLIQGGMGVKVSTSSLVLAVLECMCSGTLASVGLGYGTKENDENYFKASIKWLLSEIRKILKNRRKDGGLFLVNVMHALTNFEDLVRTAASMPIDGIVSGAGLPLNLPELVDDKSIALIPIVSSAKAAKIFVKRWKRHYDRYPDAIIIEGREAGGHLGFKHAELLDGSAQTLHKILEDVITYLRQEELKIPIIVGGGIHNPKEAAILLKMGASAIQKGTEFITTDECSVDQKYKDVLVECTEDDIIITKTPVGMPGRALKRGIVRKILAGEKVPFRCECQCLKTCDIKNAQFCIARALFDATDGDTENGLFFTGAKAPEIKKIFPVKELIDDFLEKMFFEYKKRL